MSEEKLTVAELMARAAQEGHTSDAPRRRRRRSLEDGGVSVAELTGSIPAVKERPAEAKHSAVPIDAPVGAEAAGPEPQSEVAAPEGRDAEPPAASAAPKSRKPEQVPEPAVPDPEEEASVETAGTARPVPSNEETMVLSIVDEKDPIRLTTGAFPVVPASAATPLVQKRDKGTSGEAAARAEFADSGAELTPDPTVAASAAAVASSSEHTSLLEPIADADIVEVADDGEGGKSSFLPILLMAVVGVVLGVVVFLVFEMLWERLNFWLVGLLAVVVTLVMVSVTHTLRTSRDRFSMVLAGIVGLVMTFGPLAIVG